MLQNVASVLNPLVSLGEVIPTQGSSDKEQRVADLAKAALPFDVTGAISTLDIVVTVLSFLTPGDASIAAQVCRWWRRLLREDCRLVAQVARNGDCDLSPILDEEPIYHLRMNWAAFHGYLEILKWGREGKHLSPWNSMTCASVLLGEHFQVLKWLKANGCEWDLNLLRRASTYFGYDHSLYVCELAALRGDLETLKLLRLEIKYTWDDTLLAEYAGNGGNLEILKWILANGCHWNDIICDQAALNGHLHVLVWALEEKGFSLYARLYALAAEGGHLNVLEWLRQENCPWDASAYASAAKNGHTHTMQWVKDQGANCEETSENDAEERGNVEESWPIAEGEDWNLQPSWHRPNSRIQVA